MAIVTHLFDIIGVQAFLHIYQPSPCWMYFTLQIRHKWLHSGACKQSGWIIFRHERSRVDNTMSSFRKKSQEYLPQFISCHDVFISFRLFKQKSPPRTLPGRA